MKPAPLSYRSASTLAEALTHLASPEPPKILAGGQSLVPMLNLRLAPADSLLDISRVSELRAVSEIGASVRYGALTTHAAFEDGKVPDFSNGLMCYAAGKIAYRAVRTRGTIGGSLALADPAADWLTVVIGLEGRVHLSSPRGQRNLSAQDFVLGPYLTDLAEDELIYSIEIPKRPATEKWGHYKIAVKTGEYAESFAVALIDPAGRSARIVLGATDGAPIVMSKAGEAVARGGNAIDVRNSIAEDFALSGRNFSAAKSHQHAESVLRAVREARRA